MIGSPLARSPIGGRGIGLAAVGGVPGEYTLVGDTVANAGVALVTGIAPDANASTATATFANAVVASVTGTAQTATRSLKTSAGVASVTGTAPTAQKQTAAGVASVTATVHAATRTVTLGSVGVANVTATAHDGDGNPSTGDWQLEANTDSWLLEDASGVWQVEVGTSAVKASDFTPNAAPAAGDGVPFVAAYETSPVNNIADFDDLKSALLADAFVVAGTPTDGYVLKLVAGVPTWVAP